MKIIYRGEAPEEKIIRFSCKKCYTVFEATGAESFFVPMRWDASHWTHKCPVCENQCSTPAGSTEAK